MSLEEKENGIEQENNTPEPAGHTGEAGSENSAPVKRRPQNRRPVQRRTARPKNTSEEGRKAEGAESTVQTEGAPEAAEKKEQNRRAPRRRTPAPRQGQGTGRRQVPAPLRNTDETAAALPVKRSARGTKKDGKGKLKVIPLGGLEQIGMNITAFEYEDSIIVVDCGLAFPGDDMLGIDLVIPDVTYLKQNIDRVKGFVITHGHEDHIGALPYILQQVNVPIYGTKLTIALIEHKLKEHNLLKTTKRRVMKHGQSVNLGCFRVEFIKTNHSIQDASALAIFSPVGIVLHTGDFKIDYTPVFGDPIDLQRFAELGKKGVLAMMADSTNATRPGFTMSERSVGKTFDAIFAEHTNHRIIVATFASNVDRVQQVVNTAYKYGRKVVVEGRSMVTIIDIASELGYINIPDGTLIDIDQLKNYPPESTVLITTGSQGESMAALSRMAASIHKKVSIMPGDVVVLSSSPIPGNEKAVGLDFFADPAREKEANLAMQSGQYTIAGPFELRQGGMGVLLFDPIYTTDEQGEQSFWGFSVMVLNWENFIEDMELQSLENASYHYQIWRRSMSTGEKVTIAQCDNPVLDNPLEVVCEVPNDTWYFEIVPKNGWISRTQQFFSVIFAFVLATLLTMGYWQSAWRRHREVVYAEKLGMAARKEKQANEAKTRFLFNMSHDMRICWINTQMNLRRSLII